MTSVAADEAPRLLLDARYPLEVSSSKSAALLHWLDSLAGLSGRGFTAGKTIEAHREEYLELFGLPNDEATAQLRAFSEMRQRFAARPGPKGPDELTLVIFKTQTLDEAQTATSLMLPEKNHRALFEAMRYFEPRFDERWRGGVRRAAFLEASDAKLRRRLADYLLEVARFFGVDADALPAATIHVFAIPAGWGTHAQAIDDHLLIEVRPGEGLEQQIAPVVHEACHYLYYAMGRERIASYRALAEARGEAGMLAWRALHEALPTALAQGVATERYAPRFSFRVPWYHRDEVDRYAKAIYPKIRRALRKKRVLDEAFVAELLDLFVEATPRSP